MTTLIISAPWYKKDSAGNPTGRPGQSHSWETYFQTHVGLGYVLYPDEFNRLSGAIGSAKVVLLRNDKERRRAEAHLSGLTRRRQTKNGQWRYDVSFEDPKEVTPYVYRPEEKLKENGVRVI